MRSILFVVAATLFGCSKPSSLPAPPDAATDLATTASMSASPTPSTPSAPSLDAGSKTAGASDTATNDFEDQFQYGKFDAGAADPGALTKNPGFVHYANNRFGFGLDIPKALTAMPEPDNGDGMQWRLGNLVAITASGMNWMPELGGAPCATSKNVMAHTESKTGCFATGKENGYIFWEKHVISHDVDFSLRFQYVESLKAQMDPIVTRVNASWKF